MTTKSNVCLVVFKEVDAHCINCCSQRAANCTLSQMLQVWFGQKLKC